MLFGFDDSLKDLKKELKSADGDVAFLKGWQKTFDKVKKQHPILESQYVQAKKELEIVCHVLKDMEQNLIGSQAAFVPADLEKRFVGFSKELKKYQSNFNHEFLIGKEDKEFHLTYATLLVLCTKPIKSQKEVLILQSEVENLLAVAGEALEREWPDFRAMAFFYLEYTDRELLDIPHAEKVIKVNHLYEREFLRPVRQILEASLGEVRTKQILEVELCLS